MRSLRDMGVFYQHAPEVSMVTLACDPVQTLVRTHAATHMPFPPDSCGHKKSCSPGGAPETKGLLTDSRSNWGHRFSNPCTTPVVSKSAKVHAA